MDPICAPDSAGSAARNTCTRVPGRLDTRTCIPALPFCHVRLSARKVGDPAYPKDLKSLGDHVRKARLDRKLLQQDVAKLLGVDETSVWQWERNRTDPQIYCIPAIYDFLGYAPWEPPDRFAAWLRQARRGLGLSRRKLATRIGVDPTTVDRWERAYGEPNDRSLWRLRSAMTNGSAAKAAAAEIRSYLRRVAQRRPCR